MSTSSESDQPSPKAPSEFELDLDLHFLPSWAVQPQESGKYERFRGDEGGAGGGRGDRRGGGGGFNRGPRPPGGGGGGGGGRPGGGFGGGGRAPGAQFGRGPRPAGAPGGDRGDRRGGPGRGPGRGPRRDDQHERREAPAPLPQLDVAIIPEEKGVESLARQIKLTGRAYPLFEIATLILKKSERFRIELRTVKKGDGSLSQPLFVCSLDDTLWLSEQEAAAHILDKHFATFYQTEKIAGEPPKGTYTFVAQCGISGVILGPPNYHDYQAKLHRLHQERFGNMPFEVYKSRIKIVRDEETVNKWKDEQSWKTQFITLNVPESQTLMTREEVDEHFKQTHLANVIRKEERFSLPAPVAQNQPNQQLRRLINITIEDQRRFPLKVVTTLSEQFQKHGLQFFKAHKNVTHVSVARPRHLDVAATPVSEGIKKIVDFIESKQNTSRKALIEYFTPGVQLKPDAQAGAAQTEQPPSPEAEELVRNLHWLIHEGHVIEFSSGVMQLARKPVPKPPRPEPKKKDRPATAAEGAAPAEGTAPTEGAPTTEGAAPTQGAPAIEEAAAEPAQVSQVAEPASQEVIEQAAGSPVEQSASASPEQAQAAEDPAALPKPETGEQPAQKPSEG